MKHNLIKKERNSNVELLRIIAMCMILILHVDYFSLGVPNAENLSNNPLQTWGRMIFEMCSIGGVNIFVLISGWFGITFTFNRLKSFLYQCLFILLIAYFAFTLLGYCRFNIHDVLRNVLLIDTTNGWFVLAYLFLMILSPLLNAYCTSVNQSQLGVTIVSFYLMQSVYGAFSTSLQWLANGYSPFSFIGLYLLARYMNMYGARYYRFAGRAYVVTLLIQISTMFIAVATGMVRPMQFAMSYANPIIIVNSLSLLIIFATQPPRYNHAVNIVAKSCFAVYLIHNCNSTAIDLYKSTAVNIFQNYSSFSYLVIISIFIATVFVISILLDQIRLFTWNKLNTPQRKSAY